MGGDRQLERARKKLEQFLKSSVHYRASSLLSKIQNTDMYSEMAILFGRVSRAILCVWVEFFRHKKKTCGQSRF